MSSSVWYTLSGTPTTPSTPATQSGLLPPLSVSPSRRKSKSRSHAKAIEVLAVTKHTEEVGSAAWRVYHCLELMTLVVLPLTWDDIVNIGHTNRFGLTVAGTVVDIWLCDILSPFIKRSLVPKLYDSLNVVRGCITGSIVRRLLSFNAAYLDDESLWADSSQDVNFVVPTVDHIAPLKQTVEQCMGIKTWTTEDPHPCYARTVSTFITGYVHSESRPGKRLVTISASRGNILDVVLSSPFSAQQNLLTSSRVYCFWPNLKQQFQSYASDQPSVRLPTVMPLSFTDNFDEMVWDAPCGAFCPANQRKTIDDNGIALFRYTLKYEATLPKSRSPNTDYLLAQSCICFRLRVRCENGFCHNYIPETESIRTISLF